tara:strand:- start:170 stop:592 length:423 start_codon:yes stop_codon:yes gene_type:complete
MAGFNNTPPASEFRNATSWGRTRQPKNLAGANTTPLAAPTTDNPTVVTDGYATENQRFLHVSLKNAAADVLTVQIWAYSHAFGTWGILTDVRGTAATVTANDSTAHKVIEISGVDRVYFKKTGASTFAGADALFAAASTF